MFKLDKYKDRLNREYRCLYTTDAKGYSPVRVNFMMLTKNCDDYVDKTLKSIKNQAHGIYAVDGGSTDNTIDILKKHGVNIIPEPSSKFNDCGNAALQAMEPGWVFMIDADEVLFELPDEFIGRLAAFMETNRIYAADTRTIDFIYNYGTLMAEYDWGEGTGRYWTARRLFRWTGSERFVNPYHFNISNIPEGTKNPPFNNEHTGEWIGDVLKVNQIQLFHYGKLRGVEKMRGKLSIGELQDKVAMMRGLVGTKPYFGPHPKVMEL